MADGRIKTYSRGELRLLAAEGRLKGRGVRNLVTLGRTAAARSVQVTRAEFERRAAVTPCWVDPAHLLKTFLDLVAIPSPSGREEGVADYVSGVLHGLGIDEIERDLAGNVVADVPPTDPRRPCLLFTAHMDCAYPGGDTPIQTVFHDSGMIATDGGNSLGADDKAGVAAILAALGYVLRGRVAHGGIKVLFTVQEEMGWRGIKQVPARILNGVHLVLAMDPPVRVEHDETAHMAVLHAPPGHFYEHLARAAARNVGEDPLILFAEDGYVGGDTICLSPLGAFVIDFCSGSRYPHTTREHLHFHDLALQTSWMIATAEEALALDAADLDLRAVYGDEPIGNLTGVRKQIPLTEDLLKSKIELAESLAARPGPEVVAALGHLSAMAPRAGDPRLLSAVVGAYGQCTRQDQVPQVLRALTASLTHLATNLADVRPLEPLIATADDVVRRGGDDQARVNAIRFLEELYGKERRVAVKARIVDLLIVQLQGGSPQVVDAVKQFLVANLDDTIHALTVAFCHRHRSGWERSTVAGGARIVGGRRIPRQEAGWTLIRQRILQLLLEQDRLLPEMLDWIFTHDGAATQRIAVGYVDPGKGSRIADRILRNLRSREQGIQETAVHFVGTHRMVQAVDALLDLLLLPRICRNRSLVEWALDAIGLPALNKAITRLGGDVEFEPLIRRLFNRHDTSTDEDFQRAVDRLRETYEESFEPSDPDQLDVLREYLDLRELRAVDDLTRWDKRRAVIFYERLLEFYPDSAGLERLYAQLGSANDDVRGHLTRMAVQKNLFEDPALLNLIAHENARFVEHFVRLENIYPQRLILSRIREFTAGVPVDMQDPQDVEIYYLYLLKQSPKMPDRSRYLKHIEEARLLTFPPPREAWKPFTIAGDRIEEVGTVDRERIRDLVEGLPRKDDRAHRLRQVVFDIGLARREQNRIVNGLAEAFGVDIAPYSTVEERLDALCREIDFEFDSAYRPVPQVCFPLLLRVRMKHRNDAVLEPLAGYALEFALINHPEIADSFESGEVDLTLDALDDLLTDRVYEAEKDLSEDVFPELLEKHKQALAQFYTSQWKGIVRDLKKQARDSRVSEVLERTEETMLELDVFDEEAAAVLDSNLTRLVAVVRPGPETLTYHLRHREFYKVYDAVLRVRNIRQLKRIYREMRLVLQDQISYANREHAEPERRRDATLDSGEESEPVRRPHTMAPGYLKYARKEMGKLDKLTSDFVLERALADRVAVVRSEVVKLRQVVVGSSQILCTPCKDVSIVYRSWPGNDCNMGDIDQVLSPDCTFYKIVSDGLWKGYFTLVELRRRDERALLVDVVNFSGLRMDNESFIKVLMHQVIQTARSAGFSYILTSSNDNQISNRDYIRRAFRKAFPHQRLVQGFALAGHPAARFQSLQANLSVAWERAA